MTAAVGNAPAWTHARVLAGAAVLGVVATGLLATGQREPQGLPTALEVFSGQSRQGVPVVAPVGLPPGYEFWGLPHSQWRGGHRVATSWHYRPAEGPRSTRRPGPSPAARSGRVRS